MLIFFRRVASIEKAAEAQVEANLKGVVIVGLLLLALIGFAILLYVKNQAEAGRLVIDLAAAFFGWATGRAVGEKAGATAGPS